MIRVSFPALMPSETRLPLIRNTVTSTLSPIISVSNTLRLSTNMSIHP